MNNLRSKRAGDTIIEVMIAIIVLGAALGTSIAIATKSQKQTQANHEFYQAQLYANQQAEYILSAYNEHMAEAQASGTTVPVARDQFLDLHSDTTAFCYEGVAVSSKVDVAASTCKKIDGAEFNISVLRSSETQADGTTVIDKFVISINWDSLTGSDQDTVELVYAI